ncbi:hypothetical protein DLM76_15390 [Leptospira yasudae]|uniref:hypothetical protein n=1 Tax=Leptospira yasudae TaxID=2202201 RepID=UPI000E59CD9E|nr:hypothetical protein [Leptospira yasudae]RHX93450.1 hypothetical protein DLM76_15390 [Leptospira yasudae]TGK24813.1 hypothetical protein EHQ05_18165 [Leptospira yasudae]TGM09303.1 hypothetical protein EHQ86_01315 [Leptospira yasudae]
MKRIVLILFVFTAFTHVQGGDWLVLKPNSPLYLFPDKKSEILRRFGFGEIVQSKNEKEKQNEKRDRGFRFVSDSTGLSGWAETQFLFDMEERGAYKIILRSIDRMLYSTHTGLTELESVYQYLSSLEENGIYHGDEYLYLKIRRAVVLVRILEILQEGESKRKESKLQDYLSKVPGEIIPGERGKPAKINPEVFWKIGEEFRDKGPGDFAAFLGVKHTPELNCKRDVFCFMNDERKRRIRYLQLNPNGNYATVFASQISKRFESLTKDPETIQCGNEKPDSRKEIYESFRKDLQSLPYRYGKKYHSFLKIIQRECLQ